MLHEQLRQLKLAVPAAPFKVCFVPTQADLEAAAAWARSVAALAKGPEAPAAPAPAKAKKYVCSICGYIYDPAAGDPDRGAAPGTPFEALPDDWTGPLCRMGKDKFEPVD